MSPHRPGMPALAALAAVLVGSAGCKAGQRDAQDPPHAGSSVGSSATPSGVVAADAALPDANLDSCRAAAATAVGLPAHERAKTLLDACKPCGDWDPLLRWSIPAGNGGPSREAITSTLVACKAYCDPNAKQRFLNNLDDARGQDTRKPWRLLGEICGAEVSAVPDARYMSPEYFALDRIARALALTVPLDIPLPAVTVTGIGITPPNVVPAVPQPGAPLLTVDATQVLLGAMPLAALTATGLTVHGDYPGAPVALSALSAALGKLDLPAVVLASAALRAARIAAVVASGDGRSFRLAAALPGPGGWTVPGAIPIDLTGRSRGVSVALTLSGEESSTLAAVAAAPAADLTRASVKVTVDDAARVDALAHVLAALANRGATTAVLVGPPPPPARKQR